MTTPCVFLWSPPRCVSTAFELTIRQLPDVKCYHEPFMGPYVNMEPPSLLPRLISTGERFQLSDESKKTCKTFDAVFRDIQDSVQCGKYEGVFTKSMAVFFDYHYDLLLSDCMREASRHTFLIRHPLRVAHSFMKYYHDRGLEFTPELMSFKPLYDLYKFVNDNLPATAPPAVVVDMDHGLLNPEEMLSKYCKATGLKYKPGMATKWTKKFTLESMGADPEVCGKSHDVALSSTGLVRLMCEKPLPSDEDLPEQVKQAVREEMPYYEYLSRVAMS